MDARGLEPQERVPASRKLGRDKAQQLVGGASRLVVAKGKKVTAFDGAALRSEEAVLAMLGPTGNLRAPTLQVGDTVLVGFNQQLYEEVLG